MFHKINIKQKHTSGNGTTVEVDGKELRGIRGIEYSVSVGEIPSITLEIIPEVCGIETLADLELRIGIDSLDEAIRCIRLSMKLDDEFRKAVIASARSAIEDVRNANRTDVVNDYELATMIIDRIFLGDR